MKPLNFQLKLVLAILFLLAFAVNAWLGLTSSFGMTWDDGWYLVGGKAIAAGQGYRMLFVPGEPFQVGFPPLYSAVLALVWRVWSDFPHNLLAFKSLNIAAAVVILAATYLLISRTYAAKPFVAVATVGMLSTSLLFSMFIDSTMSEMVFLALLSVAMLMAERIVTRERLAPGWWVALAAVTTLPLLTRTAGLALGGAVVAWLLIHRRWRPVAIYSISYVGFNAPWLLWTQWAQRHGLAGSWTYASWLNQHTHGFKPSAFLHNVLENSGAVWATHLPNVLMPAVSTHFLDAPLARWHVSWVGAAALWLAVGLCLAGLLVSARERLRVMHLFLVLSIVMIVPYPAELADVGRYIAVLSPWWLYGLARGTRSLYDALSINTRMPMRAIAGALAMSLIGMNVSEGVLMIAKQIAGGKSHDERLSPRRRAHSADLASLSEWIRARLPADTILLYEREPQIYLATNRQAIGIPDTFEPSVLQQVGQGRPTYLVCRSGSDEQHRFLVWQQAHRRAADPVFISPHRVFVVYALMG